MLRSCELWHRFVMRNAVESKLVCGFTYVAAWRVMTLTGHPTARPNGVLTTTPQHLSSPPLRLKRTKHVRTSRSSIPLPPNHFTVQTLAKSNNSKCM